MASRSHKWEIVVPILHHPSIITRIERILLPKLVTTIATFRRSPTASRRLLPTTTTTRARIGRAIWSHRRELFRLTFLPRSTLIPNRRRQPTRKINITSRLSITSPSRHSPVSTRLPRTGVRCHTATDLAQGCCRPTLQTRIHTTSAITRRALIFSVPRLGVKDKLTTIDSRILSDQGRGTPHLRPPP